MRSEAQPCHRLPEPWHPLPEDVALPLWEPTCLQCLLLSMHGRGSSG